MSQKSPGKTPDELRERFIKSSTVERDFSFYEAHVHPEVMGYGTSPTERIFKREHLIELANLGIEEGEKLEKSVIITPVHKNVLADGRCTLFVDEVQISIKVGEEQFQLNLRLSTVWQLNLENWVLMHWHYSMPHEAESESGSYPIGKWQKKNAELEALVADKTKDLELSLAELKATQSQLIQSEKLASLGQLAAGIAHEIKNPMNFINNFSELSLEFLDEIKEALAKLRQNETTQEISELIEDVTENLKKVHHHGTRADNIVKSMLMHSRGGNGKMEPTDLNALIREYVNLAFHGMRAGKDTINVKINLELDETLREVSLNTEDFSRVILNLCKNAFDAMRTKSQLEEYNTYQAVLTVRTYTDNRNVVQLEIEDNGQGVPEAIRDKLFQPFFTTKKGTEGTGLGLSITHEIISKHQGSIQIISEENAFTRFLISLPQNQK